MTPSIVELLIYFHDYTLIVLILVMVFVTYIFGSLVFTSFIPKNIWDSHVLATLWALISMFTILFMAFPTVYLLHLAESIFTPSLTDEVSDHQWDLVFMSPTTHLLFSEHVGIYSLYMDLGDQESRSPPLQIQITISILQVY